jgi:hypothetical protein
VTIAQAASVVLSWVANHTADGSPPTAWLGPRIDRGGWWGRASLQMTTLTRHQRALKATLRESGPRLVARNLDGSLMRGKLDLRWSRSVWLRPAGRVSLPTRTLASVLMVMAACTPLGDDIPPTEDLAARCYAADMDSCDELARGSEDESPDLLNYGMTCGGRVAAGVGESCTTLFPDAREGEVLQDFDTRVEELEELASECEAGELPACGQLVSLTPQGSAYHQYGASCGRRSEPVGDCVMILLPPALPTELVPVDSAEASAAEACRAGDLSSCDSLRASANSDVAMYGTRCGGRVSDVDKCVDWFAGQEVPPGLPLAISGASSSPLAARCFQGSLRRCDKLIERAEHNPGLALYGSTCGGRIGSVESCIAAFRALLPDPGSAPDLGDRVVKSLDRLAHRCLGTNWAACDQLRDEASTDVFPDHHEYAATCGGRVEPVDSCLADERVTNIPAATEPPTPQPLDGLNEEPTVTVEPTVTQEPTTVEPTVTVEPTLTLQPRDVTGGVTVIVKVDPRKFDVSPSTSVPGGYRADHEVLVPVFESLQNAGQTVLTFDKDLQVDQDAEVTISVLGSVPVDVPKNKLRKIGTEEVIEIVLPVHLEGGAFEFADTERSVRLELKVSPKPMLQGGAIGTFPLKPKVSEPSAIRLVAHHPRLNQKVIELDYEILLGSFHVEKKPLIQRVGDWILTGGAVANALKGIGAIVALVASWFVTKFVKRRRKS